MLIPFYGLGGGGGRRDLLIRLSVTMQVGITEWRCPAVVLAIQRANSQPGSRASPTVVLSISVLVAFIVQSGGGRRGGGGGGGRRTLRYNVVNLQQANT